ncbi:hypothetical protein ACKVMT_17815 [Halobacteriales archaeon Cl-PHB]
MAIQGARSGQTSTALPDAVPFDLTNVSRLSWELGTRVVEGDGGAVQSRWSHDETAWSLSVFDVTSETVVLRLETPVGRERFFGTTQRDLESVHPALASAPDWTRQD